MRNYYVNEGLHIGGQEAQALGTSQKRLKASADVVKGQLVEVSGEWTVGIAGDKSNKVVGVAFGDAESGENVVVETAGFWKLESTTDVVAGDKVVSAGAGKVRKYISASDGDATIVGLVMAGCTADGTAYVKVRL